VHKTKGMKNLINNYFTHNFLDCYQCAQGVMTYKLMSSEPYLTVSHPI